MNIQKIIRIVGALTLLTVAAQADWNPGDPYKMHYPQMPDPDGWDVKVDGPNVVADDFKCTEDGLITEVHFWGSWIDDIVGNIDLVHLSIHTDDRTGEYSKPGLLLWDINLDNSNFTLREWGPYDPDRRQGFYDPWPTDPLIAPQNHGQTWQVNLKIPESIAFEQKEGEIYWLDIHVVSDWVVGQQAPQFGWKTSLDQFEDDAVYEDQQNEWQELFDPSTGVSMDMAFVIVPEPNVIVMILMTGGSFIFVRRRFLI